MSAKNTTNRKTPEGFTDKERTAMRERARELKAEARANKSREAGERDVLAKLAEMPEPDRVLGERLHAVVMAAAPTLSPRLWYGQPAYAKDGKVICFFQGAYKYNTRYATFGFSDDANLEEGTMWPTAFALTGLSEGDGAVIGALVKKAVS